MLQDGLVVRVAQRAEHQNHGDVRSDVRQLRADLPSRDLAVLVSLSAQEVTVRAHSGKPKYSSR